MFVQLDMRSPVHRIILHRFHQAPERQQQIAEEIRSCSHHSDRVKSLQTECAIIGHLDNFGARGWCSYCGARMDEP